MIAVFKNIKCGLLTLKLEIRPFFLVLSEPKTSCVSGKCSPMERHPQTSQRSLSGSLILLQVLIFSKNS